MKKNVLKSAKTLLTVVACTSMLFTAFSGCKNPIEDDTTRGGGQTSSGGSSGNATLSSEKKLTLFAFKKELNPGLSEDVKGLIGTVKDRRTGQKRDVVFIRFPAGTTTETTKTLKPTFEVSTKAAVSVGTKKLTSGMTAEDFSDLKKGTNLTVTAEDGSTHIYNVAVEIALPEATEAEIAKLLGSYTAKLNDGKPATVVFEENKVTLYTMSMGPKGAAFEYVNIGWYKKLDGSFQCVTYKRGLPKINNLSGKNGYDFTVSGTGKTTVKSALMGVYPFTAEKDDTTFAWTADNQHHYPAVSFHI